MFKIDNNFVAKKATLEKLDVIELNNKADKILDFLSVVHPFLTNKTIDLRVKDPRTEHKAIPAIEIKTFKREHKPFEVIGQDKDGKDIRYNQVHKTFTLFSNTEMYLKNKLINKLDELYNKKSVPFCTFFSTHTLNDYIQIVDEDSLRKKGYSEKKITCILNHNHINVKNSLSTQIVSADFDHITVDEMNKELERFNKIGLNPNIVVSSGHGFHLHWLLKEPIFTFNRKIFVDFHNSLISKGFRNDEKIGDIARVLRVPYTLNCKDPNNITEVELLYCNTDFTYTEQDLFNALDKLEDVVPLTPIKEKSKVETKVKKEKDLFIVSKENKSNNNVKYELLDEAILKEEFNKLYCIYPLLQDIPEPVKQLMMGFRKGMADVQLLFLITYLYRNLGMDKATITNIVNVMKVQDRFNWAWADDGYIKEKIDRVYHEKKYNAGGIYLSNKLNTTFGFVDWQFQDRSTIMINNYIFTKISEIGTASAIVYLKMLVDNNYNNTTVFELNDCVKKFNISKRNIQPHFQKLCDARILDKKRSAKKKGETYDYILSAFTDDTKGFTKFNAFVLKTMIRQFNNKELNATQLCILIYLAYRAVQGKFAIAQDTIAENFGLNQSNISKNFKKLIEYDYVTREKVYTSNVKYHYEYVTHFLNR